MKKGQRYVTISVIINDEITYTFIELQISFYQYIFTIQTSTYIYLTLAGNVHIIMHLNVGKNKWSQNFMSCISHQISRYQRLRSVSSF